MYLGIKVVLAKSFARIHHANLVNFGIVPLVFKNSADYELLARGDELQIDGVMEQLKQGKVLIRQAKNEYEIEAKHNLSTRQLDIIEAGGLLNYTRQRKTE